MDGYVVAAKRPRRPVVLVDARALAGPGSFRSPGGTPAWRQDAHASHGAVCPAGSLVGRVSQPWITWAGEQAKMSKNSMKITKRLFRTFQRSL